MENKYPPILIADQIYNFVQISTSAHILTILKPIIS